MLSSLLFLICALRPIILHLQTIQIQSLQLYFSVYFQLSVHWGRDRIKFQLNLFFVLWIVACSRAQRSTHITNEIDFRVFYFDIWLVDVSGVERSSKWFIINVDKCVIHNRWCDWSIRTSKPFAIWPLIVCLGVIYSFSTPTHIAEPVISRWYIIKFMHYNWTKRRQRRSFLFRSPKLRYSINCVHRPPYVCLARSICLRSLLLTNVSN